MEQARRDIILLVKATLANWCRNFLQLVNVFTTVILSATKGLDNGVFLVLAFHVQRKKILSEREGLKRQIRAFISAFVAFENSEGASGSSKR